jgi:putative PEP-CTERM system histidine kinase
VQTTALFLFSGGTLAFLVVAALIVLRRQQVFEPASGLAAVLALSAWQATLAWNTVHPLPGLLLMTAECVRVLGLLVYLARSLRAAAGHWPATAATISSSIMALGIPLLLALAPQLTGNSGMEFTALRAWSGVFIAVGLLIALEQVFRNAAESLSLLRYSCVALGVTVVYDLYLFADALIFELDYIDPDLWAARGGVNAVCAVFLSTAISRNRVDKAISFSRSVVFYTASLTAAGLFLFTVSVIGFSLRSVGGSWGVVLQLMLFFGALLLIVTASMSQRFRDSLRGQITRNFFALRYDYREEWLQLIREMSARGDGDELYVRAVRLMSDLYKCPGGLLWLRYDGEFVPVAPCRMRLPEDSKEPADSAFCRQLATDWIFELNVSPPPNTVLPPVPRWISQVPDLGVIVPLLLEDELIGFVGLQRSLGFAALDWEDLSILRTAARQIASYIARHQAGEELARARQFETYNQLTAFIMHDLKNLIAQQELVVKNAAKHKDNPAFVEDAIDTIQNSVARMSALLGKLQQRSNPERRALGLQEVLLEAVRKCQQLTPKPALRIEDTGLRVLSDRDHLVMILSHLIKNAQEATAEDGYVDVRLRRSGDSALIEVEDNGSGMDPDFVRNRLFKPFESTKMGKGMGIGAYQARQFVRDLGGEVQVMSAPGAGTTFSLTLPLAQMPADILRGVG